MAITAINIVIAVLCFVYFALSFTIFMLSFILYCRNKYKLRDAGLEFDLPRFTWFLAYFLWIAFVMVYGLDQFLNIGPWVLGVFAGCAVICNCSMFCTAQNCAMCHSSDVEGGAAYAQQMRDTRPQLYFHIECWHFETTRTPVYATDEHGNRYLDHIEETTRKVTTLNIDRYFGIPYWCDATNPLFLPGGRLMVHVISTSVIIWMDNSIDRLRTQLENRYSCYDDYYSLTQHQFVPGVIDDKMIVMGDAKEVPCLLNGCVRFLWIIFGFGLSLALYIATVASVVRYEIIKKCSMSERCVTPDWCKRNNVDYLAIQPTYNVLDINNVGGEKTSNADEVTQPCVRNPLPLICTEVWGKPPPPPKDGQVVPTDGSQEGAYPQPPQQDPGYPQPPQAPMVYPVDASASSAAGPSAPTLTGVSEYASGAKAIVDPEHPGKVIIKVNKAINLPEADVASAIDPYFVFTLNGKTVKTSTKIDSKDPTFNETLEPLEFDPASKEKVIKVELWDKDNVKPDELCATGEISFGEYWNNKRTEWFNLSIVIKDDQPVNRHPQIELEIEYTA